MAFLRRFCSSSLTTRTPEKLFSKIELEIRAHQPAVLKSYGYFVNEAAKGLDVNVTLDHLNDSEPHKTRKTLLKSAFAHSKHRVQYEMRTYYRFINVENLTESTANTFLEYVQRNLPEGVSMKVTSHEMCELPRKFSQSID